MKTKGRILVIDDNDAVLASIRSALMAAGYEVVATAQIVGAGRHLKGCDLVILDYHMPGLDGHEVLGSLRAAATSAQSKAVFYLYTSDRDVEIKTREMGFDGSFRSKGNLALLVQQVDSALRLVRLKTLQNT